MTEFKKDIIYKGEEYKVENTLEMLKNNNIEYKMEKNVTKYYPYLTIRKNIIGFHKNDKII